MCPGLKIVIDPESNFAGKLSGDVLDKVQPVLEGYGVTWTKKLRQDLCCTIWDTLFSGVHARHETLESALAETASELRRVRGALNQSCACVQDGGELSSECQEHERVRLAKDECLHVLGRLMTAADLHLLNEQDGAPAKVKRVSAEDLREKSQAARDVLLRVQREDKE